MGVKKRKSAKRGGVEVFLFRRRFRPSDAIGSLFPRAATFYPCMDHRPTVLNTKARESLSPLPPSFSAVLLIILLFGWRADLLHQNKARHNGRKMRI